MMSAPGQRVMPPMIWWSRAASVKDRLAVEGRMAHWRQVALIVQAMAIQIFIVRSKLRKEIEDQAVEGGCEDTRLPEPKHLSIDAIFPPRESDGVEAEEATLGKLIQRFPNAMRGSGPSPRSCVRGSTQVAGYCRSNSTWRTCSFQDTEPNKESYRLS